MTETLYCRVLSLNYIQCNNSEIEYIFVHYSVKVVYDYKFAVGHKIYFKLPLPIRIVTKKVSALFKTYCLYVKNEHNIKF